MLKTILFSLLVVQFYNICAAQADFPQNCVDDNIKTSGIYKIKVNKFGEEPFDVACDMDKDGGGWLVIQRRQDGSVNFYRYWSDYAEGFGDLSGEFWIGLDKMHALTNGTQQELLIYMEDFDGNQIYAKYDAFAIGDYREQYALHVLGSYSGNATDSFSPHRGMKFTTRDVKNDIALAGNCAEIYMGAWWYYKCFASNLNGRYYTKEKAHTRGGGILWLTHAVDYSLKFVQMMIRPKST